MAPSRVCCPSATIVSGSDRVCGAGAARRIRWHNEGAEAKRINLQSGAAFRTPGCPCGLSAPSSSRGASLARTILFSPMGLCAVSCSGSSGRSAWRCGKTKIGSILPHAMKERHEAGSRRRLPHGSAVVAGQASMFRRVVSTATGRPADLSSK
jgi:hypothetical protein